MTIRVFGRSAILILTIVSAIHAQPVRDPIRLTHGPMLGKASAHSMAVWARTSDPGEFTVRYGEDLKQLDQISEPATTTIDHDNTGVAQLKDLQSDTRYHYQVWVDDRPHGRSGSFRTLPSPNDTRNRKYNPRGLFNFRFQIGCCASQNPRQGMGHHSPTYDILNREWADKVHFHIMNGDWLYEELRTYPPEAWRLTQGVDEFPFTVQVMPTVVGVWENYKLYLSRGVELARWHRLVPSYFTFDDHELVNDLWGSSEAGKRHRRTVFRDIGTYAWDDYLGWANPMEYDQPVHFGRATMKAGSDRLVDQRTDFTKLPLKEMLSLHVHWGTLDAGVNRIQLDNDEGHQNSYVYDIVEVIDPHTLRLHMPAKVDDEVSYSIGRRSYGKFQVSNCEFFLLDTRGDRDMHDVQERGKPGVSMIGRHQREWLLRNMRESNADFFFVVSTVPFMIPHTGAGGFEIAANKEESWTGFFHERELLIREWEKLGKKVFVMTGDLHNSFAIRASDHVWEFCCGPHNSLNHVPAIDENNRPATGKWTFGPRECDIRWSTYVLPDVPFNQRLRPHFCVVQINNVFNTPRKVGETRWLAYPHPQVVFQFYDGKTGDLAYAESITVAH